MIELEFQNMFAGDTLKKIQALKTPISFGRAVGISLLSLL